MIRDRQKGDACVVKRILLRVLFIVLAAFTGLMATVNPATLILTALSIFAAVKVDFFAGRNEDTGRKPAYRWAWLWAVVIFFGTFFMTPGVITGTDNATADLSRSVPAAAVTEEEPEPAEEADGFGQEPAEEPVPVEEPEPEPEPEPQPEPEPAPAPEPEPAPQPEPESAPEPEPAPEPVPVAEPEPVAAEPASVNYVGNKNTGKFHCPSCSSVSDMKESNKLYWTGSRDELIAQGYVPCARCHP